MASLDAGRTASQRSSDVSLGLVGVPSFSEPIQTANAFEFDANPDIDNAAFGDSIFADFTDFCTDLSQSNGQSLNDFEAMAMLPPLTDIGGTGLSQNFAANEQYDLLTYDPADLGLFPVQQNFSYPDPQDCYTAQEAPYFQNVYNAFALPADAFGTLGLSAIPGNNVLTGFDDMQYTMQQYNYLPDPWTLPVQSESLSAHVADKMPVDPSLKLGLQSPHEDVGAVPATHVAGSARPMVGAPMSPTPSMQSSDSDSDEEYRNQKKPAKISKRQQRQERRQSEISSACTAAGTPAEPVKYNAGEKPKKDDTKPWVRINTNTEGDTRTAKINNWKNEYKYKPLPMGSWTSGKYTFRYTQNCNVDFLTDAPMSTRKIREYIVNYPCDDEKRLILWIQKMPADTSRRYGSSQHAKCVFKECPAQKYVQGTINTGEYRIAFDEKHFTHGGNVDPYDCTAYAHLYCMEQFLDFDLVCQIADVRVDVRHDMPLEPNKHSAFSMVDVPARDEMECFVKLASHNKLRWAERWANYPVHEDYGPEDQKPHEYTLTYLAHCMYENHQDRSHKKQAALRRVTVSQRRVHLGDLEMAVADKRIEQDIFKGKKKGQKHADHYSQRIWNNINRAKKEAKDFLAAIARGTKRNARGQPKKGRKPRAVQYHEYVESGEDEPTYSAGTRKTRQKKQKVNYAESPVEQLHQYDEAAYMQAQAELPVQATDIQHLATYLGHNSRDTSQPVVNIDPMLDNPYGLYAVPVTPKLNIEDFNNFPACEADIPDDNLEQLLSLERRQSCADSGPTSILKSPGLVSGRSSRRAGFGVHPVTDSKKYGVDDPPSAMFVRRSGRLRARLG